MRQLKAPIVALSLIATMLVAAIGAADATPGEAEQKAADDIMAYYPSAAKAAGVQGQAMLDCGQNEHAALTGCTLAWERPKRFGFGEAALKLAALSRDNPKVTIAATSSGHLTPFRFCLQQPAITPNTLLPLHVRIDARISKSPTPKDIARAYPPAALQNNQSGRVVLNCAVGLNGAVGSCRATEENPQGQGFGAAAEKLAPKFRGTPLIYDSEPRAGGPVWPEIVFGSNPPLGPLQVPGTIEQDCRLALPNPN